MKEKIAIALQDITVIKETLEDTKVHFRGMYHMCFLMAVFNGVKYLWMLLEIRFLSRVMLGGFVIRYLWPLLLVFSFLMVYRREKKHSNRYYLGMIGVWGFMAGVIPAMAALVDLIRFFAAAGHGSGDASQMRGSLFMESISSILLLSIFLVICGYLLQKRVFMILAILNLFCYMVLETCFASAGIPFPIGGQPQARLVYSSVYSMIVTCLGYLALGRYLLGVQSKRKV